MNDSRGEVEIYAASMRSVYTYVCHEIITDCWANPDGGVSTRNVYRGRSFKRLYGTALSRQDGCLNSISTAATFLGEI